MAFIELVLMPGINITVYLVDQGYLVLALVGLIHVWIDAIAYIIRKYLPVLAVVNLLEDIAEVQCHLIYFSLRDSSKIVVFQKRYECTIRSVLF